MADTKEEKTMPSELAIQRELSYRRKIAALRLHPNDKPINKPLPLQVIPSGEASHPTPSPSPSSIPLASPYISGTKRKEPTGSTNHEAVIPSSQASHPKQLPAPTSIPISSPCVSSETKQKEPTSQQGLQHEPMNRTTHPPLQYEARSSSHHSPLQNPRDSNLSYKSETDYLYCKICKVTCSSPFNLKQHFRGQKHKAKVQKQFMQKVGIENERNQKHWCELCNIACTSDDLLEMHFRGQRHLAEVNKLQIGKQGGVIPNQRKCCEICNIWCPDESAFGQHLQGKKHIFQVHAMETKKRTGNEEEDTMTLNVNNESGRRS